MNPSDRRPTATRGPTRRAALLAGAATLAAGRPARAQAYPARPVTLVVPYPPGGPNDVVARLVAERLGSSLNQRFLTENRGGGAASPGVLHVARAKPDGHTLLLTGASPLTITHTPADNDGVDVVAALATIVVLSQHPYVVVARAGLPARNLRELIAHAARTPGGVRAAGIPGDSGFMTEQLRHEGGLRAQIVPYAGAGPAVKDLLGGHIDFSVNSLPAVASHVAAGTLRILAIADPQRWPTLPEVATTAEEGLPNVLVSNYFSLLAPIGTPDAVLDLLNAEAARAVRQEAFVQRLRELGGLARGDSRAASAALLDSERAKWKRLLAQASPK